MKVKKSLKGQRTVRTQINGKRNDVSSGDVNITKHQYVRLEVFTAVTMKNGVFWVTEPQFVLHRRHITYPLQCPAGYCYVRFEVFTAVTMKNVVFWDIKPQFVPHRRHYVSTTELSQLMLCKIWGFHGDDYEEWRLLACYAAWLL
jgi:hypothetical protein